MMTTFNKTDLKETEASQKIKRSDGKVFVKKTEHP